MTDQAFLDRLNAWLFDECGVAEPRRVVRCDSDRIVVSKFDDGFAARLHQAIARIPELFDAAATSRAYQRAALADPASSRVAAWRSAVTDVLEGVAGARNLDRDQLAEIRAGTDSVAALLDSVLWSSPKVSDSFTPSESEVAAYSEAVARMDTPPGIFTRYYGSFEGARVENYCPGAQFARTLLAQAWSVCTAVEPLRE